MTNQPNEEREWWRHYLCNIDHISNTKAVYESSIEELVEEQERRTAKRVWEEAIGLVNAKSWDLVPFDRACQQILANLMQRKLSALEPGK